MRSEIAERIARRSPRAVAEELRAELASAITAWKDGAGRDGDATGDAPSAETLLTLVGDLEAVEREMLPDRYIGQATRSSSGRTESFFLRGGAASSAAVCRIGVLVGPENEYRAVVELQGRRRFLRRTRRLRYVVETPAELALFLQAAESLAKREEDIDWTPLRGDQTYPASSVTPEVFEVRRLLTERSSRRSRR